MYNITLPRSLKEGSAILLYDRAIRDMEEHASSKVRFDFRNLNFIEPCGIVTLWNLVDYIEEIYGSEIYYDTPEDYVANPLKYSAIDFLDDSLFFKKVMGEKLHPGSRERSTTNGLEKLQFKEFNISYITRTIRWLEHKVNLRPKSLSVLETAFGEIFNNINDHSESPIGGCSFAQMYPQKNIIKLCIGDSGLGIAKKMQQKFEVDSEGNVLERDCDFLNYATYNKVSTNTTPNNRGVGLGNLLEIMRHNKGKLKIVSNCGSLGYNYGDSDDVNLRVLNRHYQGTLVMLDFRTDTLEEDEYEEGEDLEW